MLVHAFDTQSKFFFWLFDKVEKFELASRCFRLSNFKREESVLGRCDNESESRLIVIIEKVKLSLKSDHGEALKFL